MKKYLLLFVLAFFLSSCISKNQNNEVTSQDNEKKIILALGDSLTAGYGVDEDDNYPKKLKDLLEKKGYQYDVINGGVSGNTSSDLLSRIDLYSDIKPDILILVIGGNDALRGLSSSDLKENIIAIIDNFPDTKIVLGGIDFPLNLGETYVKELKKVYNDIKKERKSIYLLLNFLKGVIGKKELNQEDGMHPNSKGYEIIVDNLFNFLKTNKLIKNDGI